MCTDISIRILCSFKTEKKNFIGVLCIENTTSFKTMTRSLVRKNFMYYDRTHRNTYMRLHYNEQRNKQQSHTTIHTMLSLRLIGTSRHKQFH